MNYNVNYERYPPQYFSGSNIHIFFDDIYIDEIVMLQFTLTEKLRPNYGYNSYTYDNIMRGSRIVQGSFRINFKKVNYIRDAVNQILEPEGDSYNNFPQILRKHASAKGLFGGEFDFSKMTFPEKFIVKKISGVNKNISNL